jgi:hypothetical protein
VAHAPLRCEGRSWPDWRRGRGSEEGRSAGGLERGEEPPLLRDYESMLAVLAMAAVRDVLVWQGTDGSLWICCPNLVSLGHAKTIKISAASVDRLACLVAPSCSCQESPWFVSSRKEGGCFLIMLSSTRRLCVNLQLQIKLPNTSLAR